MCVCMYIYIYIYIYCIYIYIYIYMCLLVDLVMYNGPAARGPSTPTGAPLATPCCPSTRLGRINKNDNSHSNNIDNDNDCSNDNRNRIVIVIIAIILVIHPISILTLSLLTLLDSNFPGDPLWTWEFHPFKLTLRSSRTLRNPQY